jgi:hypothetical protein
MELSTDMMNGIASMKLIKSNLDRARANRLILLAMEKFLTENPEFRFHQALWYMGIMEQELDGTYGDVRIMDKFSEESIKTYMTLKEKLNK